MMDEDKKHLIMLYVDDQLDEDRKIEAEKLIESSDEYRKYYDELIALQNQADEFELDNDSLFWDDQKSGIMDRLDKIEEDKVVDIPRKGNRVMIYRTLAIAASIVLVGVVSIYEVKDIPEFDGLTDKPKSIAIQQPQQDKPVAAGESATDADVADDENGEGALVSQPVAKSKEVSPSEVEIEDATVLADSDIELQDAIEPSSVITEEEDAVVDKPVMPEAEVEYRRDAAMAKSEEVQSEEAVEFETEPIVITKKESRPSPDVYSQSVQINLDALEQESIKDSPITSVDELFEQTAGVVTSKDGEIIVRGGRAGEVRYIVNGSEVIPTIDSLSAVKNEVPGIGTNEEGEVFIIGGRGGVATYIYDTLKSAQTSNFPRVYYDEELKSIARAAFADSLIYWSNRQDSLANMLAESSSPHSRDIAMKVRGADLTKTAVKNQNQDVISQYAEAVYKTAVFSPDSVEIDPFILKLKGIKKKADSTHALDVDFYISKLLGIK